MKGQITTLFEPFGFIQKGRVSKNLRKGQIMGMPIVFFGLLIAIIVVAIGLFLFLTGFLEGASVWIRGAFEGLFQALQNMVTSVIPFAK